MYVSTLDPKHTKVCDNYCESATDDTVTKLNVNDLGGFSGNETLSDKYFKQLVLK